MSVITSVVSMIVLQMELFLVTIVRVPQVEDGVVVDIKHLGDKCVFMQFHDLPGIAFLADFPKTIETD